MPDELSEVSRGQPFKPTATAWNAFVRAAKAQRVESRGATGGGPVEDKLNPSNTCLVKWLGSSEATLPAFSVLAYGDPIINLPTSNAFLTRDRPIFEADQPASATDQFVITQEIIAGQKLGRAVCSGISVVKVNVTDAGHTRATATASQTYLTSAVSGGVAILWKETGTGEKWAVIRIDESAAAGAPPTVREIRHGVLTEATGAATIQPRTQSAGTWSNDGSTLANLGYPVQIEGAAFTLKPTATVLYFQETIASGQFAILPLQYADRIGDGGAPEVFTYYSGFLSTGTQYIKGGKFFVDSCQFMSDLSILGALSVTGSVTCSSALSATTSLSSTKLILGGSEATGAGFKFQSTNITASMGDVATEGNPDSSFAKDSLVLSGVPTGGGLGTQFVHLYISNLAQDMLSVHASIRAKVDYWCGSKQGMTANKSFVDNNGNTVAVEITGGLITNWTSTPP